jgi:ATP-dependent exoDNAse (exonuclease V) beta subunit
MPGGPPVVWWDPSRLMLEVEEPVPLRHQQILEAGSEGAAASEANYTAWMQQREALRTRASAPSLTVKTVTSLAHAVGEDEAPDGSALKPAAGYLDVHVEISARPDEKRPGGRRFGALVHAMLASVDLDADADAIRASAAVHERMFDATREEIDAAIVTVGATLRHPVLRRAAASVRKGDIRRETPVVLALDDGSLAEGVLDLALREQTADFNGWTVVDFKTDQEFSKESGHYITQVSHARAVQAATALPTRGIILVI